MTENTSRIYSAGINHAGALLTDTKMLLATWDTSQDEQTNFDRLRNQNMLAKTSRKRLSELLTMFRQRYFPSQDVGETLVLLSQNNAPGQWINPLLYFFAAQNDRTLRDMVVDILYPRKQAGYVDLPVIVVENALRRWLEQGKATSGWSDTTLRRLARGILSSLRDFGVLEGKATKQITPFYLPLPSFALIAFWLLTELQSGNRVLQSVEWQLFFLDVSSVERYFIEAHQEGLLSYYAAGSVVRLEFPAATMKEYAHGFLERAR